MALKSKIFVFFLTLACLGAAVAAHAGIEDFNSALNLEGARNIKVPVPAAPENISAARSSLQDKSGNTDMSEFFRRLESIGLETGELRAVTSKIKVVFGGQSADAAAEYGYILNRLHIPIDFKESGSSRVRFDLETGNIDTIIHEYVHAERDVSASPDAPKGSPAREHYDAVHAIQADLRSQSLFYRYSWMKADEVSAYFMGEAIGTVFDAVNDIVTYNTAFKGAKPATLAEAERLGGLLIIPSAQSPKLDSWEKLMLKSYAKFGQNNVYDEAQFKGSIVSGFTDIHWTERQNIKDDIYNNVLGLKPPRTLQELVDRLNSIDNEWIRGVRTKVAEIRIKNAQKTEAKAAKLRELRSTVSPYL